MLSALATFLLCLPQCHQPSSLTLIRQMGGGPRTFPGGVSKWKWKRMQENKTKHILKERLLREKEIYEMRRRAEMEAPLNLNLSLHDGSNNNGSLAERQLKRLVTRFEKPGVQDLWTEQDGPQDLRQPSNVHLGSSSPD